MPEEDDADMHTSPSGSESGLSFRHLGANAEREVGGVALSELEGVGSTGLMRAVAWHNVLVRLGICVPFLVTHDVGCLLVGLGRPGSVSRGLGEAAIGESWRQFLVEMADTDVARSQAAWKHRDAMVGVVLARILSVVTPYISEISRARRPLELSGDAVQYARLDPRSAFTRYAQDFAIDWIQTICSNRLLPLLETEQVDMDALRLLGMFQGGNEGGDGVDLADLYNVIVNPTLADVVDFSLELLPSLLEVRQEMGQQSFGMDGYASIERVGQIESLMLSQLAYDDEVFLQKLVDRELFYHTHEKQFENERRSHHVLVDGSASMRGVREVFARGLALALCKRLALLGEDVHLRFFDSRLYDGVKVGGSSGAEVPYVLQFRAEHGRNYRAVFRQLASELSARKRQPTKSLVYILTHAEACFPIEEIQKISTIAAMYGVFVLPKGPLDLPYLDSLHRVHVIDEESLSLTRRAGSAHAIIHGVERDLGQRKRGRREEGGIGNG